MSNLPRQRKSPEELAKLRESLGMPPPMAESQAIAAEPPDLGPRPVHHPHSHHPPRPPEPVEPTLGGSMAPEDPVPHLEPPDPNHATSPQEPKPVRSLKRSERLAPTDGPPRKATAAAGKLPGHRHSELELAEIRRRSAVAAIAEGGFELPQAASKPLLGLGYLLAIGGAAAPTSLQLLAKLTDSYNIGRSLSEGYHLLLAACLAALPLATYIALKKTQSRHHAAFIVSIAFFALIFSVLHYFPSLKHGS